MLNRVYTPLWSKYRPAILRMMVNANQEPQTYQLSNHEFIALNKSKKGGFSFQLEMSNGRAVSGLKDSVIAQDLWEILQLSPTASELIASSAFQISLDKHFVLHVEKGNQN